MVRVAPFSLTQGVEHRGQPHGPHRYA